MKTESISLTLFDFLGYFVPGALFVYVTLIVGSLLVHSGRIIWIIKPEVGELLPFFIVAYLSGHLLSFVSTLTIEIYASLRVGQPSGYLMGCNPSRRRTGLLGILGGIALWPVVVPHIFLRRTIGIESLVARPMSNPLAVALRARVSDRLSRYGLANTDVGEVFPLLHHLAVELAPAQDLRLARHIALSGFMRSTSLLAVVATWAGLILVLTGRTVTVVERWSSPFVFILAPWVLAYLSFLAFLKFNRRFAFETLMIFLATQVSLDRPIEPTQL